MAKDNQVDKDIRILAEANRIREDEERSEAVRKLAREKKKREVDIFADKGSFAAKLKARRDAVESGDLEGAPEAFVNAD